MHSEMYVFIKEVKACVYERGQCSCIVKCTCLLKRSMFMHSEMYMFTKEVKVRA